MEIGVLFERFIQHGRFLREWSPRTVAIYRASFKMFEAYRCDGLGVASADHPAIDKDELNGWVLWMRERGLSPGGCNVNIRSLNSFLAWLHAEGHLNASLRIRPIRCTPTAVPTFTDAEVRSLLALRPSNRYERRTWTLVLCLLDTGIRIDEALGLEQANVDLESQQFRVTGKGRRERTVPFSSVLRRLLFKLIAKQPGRFVFQTAHGQRLMYRNAYRDVKRICELGGVQGPNVHPHAFRHFFAVNFVANGGDLYRLSRILGHSSIATTQLYLRSMTSAQVQAGHWSPLTG